MKNRKRKPAHPGGILKRQYLDVLGLSVSGLASILGVSRKTVSKIINERGSVTPNMALRLSKAFGTSAELWMNLQQAFDLWVVTHESTDWKKIKQLDFPAA